MKSMRKAIKRFNKKYCGWFYEAILDVFNSYQGYYVVAIIGPEGVPCRYEFKSCREFIEWVNGVCLY